MADVSQSTSALSDAINLLNAETDSLLVKFGQMSDKSKVWTIASRVLSGSGLWKLQNRIRALGQTINVFSEANDEALQSQLKAFEAQKKMAKHMKELRKEALAAQKIKKDDIRVQALVKTGVKEEVALKQVRNQAEAQYGKTLEALQNKQNKASKLSKAALYMKHGRMRTEQGGRASVQDASGGFGEFTSNEFMKMWDKTKQSKLAFKEWRESKPGRRLTKKMSKTWGKIKKLIDIGLSFLLKFMMYLLVATLVIMLLRKAWPMFKNALEVIGGIKKELEFALSGVIDIFNGIWKVLQGVFQGDFKKVFSGLKDIFVGVVKIALAGLSIVIKIVIAALLAIPLKILDGRKWRWGKVKEKLPKMPKMPKLPWKGSRAGGGSINTDGMAIVGERGPELVSLPGGSRVHSNRQSMGNTIHVHVNGRVGASDAEIRDIANKVAREINMRMNRTGNTMGAF